MLNGFLVPRKGTHGFVHSLILITEASVDGD